MRLSVAGSGSDGNCYLLENAEGQILCLDAGIPWKGVQITCGFNVSAIDAAVITHEHGDHASHIKDLQYHGIDCYTGWEQAEHIQEIYGQNCKRIAHNLWRTLAGGWKILPFKVPHDGIPNFAYVIEIPGENRKALYATDFEYLPVTLKTFGIDTWIIECNYNGEIDPYLNENKFSHVLKGHAGLDTVKGILDANMNESMRNVILCHLSSSNADEAVILKEITAIVPETVNVTIARKGRTFDL